MKPEVRLSKARILLILLLGFDLLIFEAVGFILFWALSSVYKDSDTSMAPTKPDSHKPYGAEHNIAILPLHDSFLMHNGYETSLEPVMRSAFEEVVGTSPKIDRKEPEKVHLQDAIDEVDPFGLVTTNDLDELLAELDVGYELRLSAFRALSLTKCQKILSGANPFPRTKPHNERFFPQRLKCFSRNDLSIKMILNLPEQ